MLKIRETINDEPIEKVWSTSGVKIGTKKINNIYVNNILVYADGLEREYSISFTTKKYKSSQIALMINITKPRQTQNVKISITSPKGMFTDTIQIGKKGTYTWASDWDIVPSYLVQTDEWHINVDLLNSNSSLIQSQSQIVDGYNHKYTPQINAYFNTPKDTINLNIIGAPNQIQTVVVSDGHVVETYNYVLDGAGLGTFSITSFGSLDLSKYWDVYSKDTRTVKGVVLESNHINLSRQH